MGNSIPTIEMKLSPMARQTGAAHVHDVMLPAEFMHAGQQCAIGDRIQVPDEGGAMWDGQVVDREEVQAGHKYRLNIRPGTGDVDGTDAPEAGVSGAEQRDRWRQHASWLAQFGLTGDDTLPVDAVEEGADAFLTLLNVVHHLELERAEARAWAWAGIHGELDYNWGTVSGNTYDGNPDELPAWLVDARTPASQEWWPVPAGRE